MAYVHMVEPRYDEISQTDGVEGKEGEEKEEWTLWTFRKILKKTPFISAGGFVGPSARAALAEGKLLCFRDRGENDRVSGR